MSQALEAAGALGTKVSRVVAEWHKLKVMGRELQARGVVWL